MLTKSILATALVIGAASTAFAEPSDGTNSPTLHDQAAMKMHSSQWNGRDAFASSDRAFATSDRVYYAAPASNYLDRASAPRDQ